VKRLDDGSLVRGETRTELELPRHYYLDESDPDIVVLHREDGSFVAAFSASGATKEGITEAARDDYYVALMERSARAS
jgi:hypothetical protein